MTELILVKAAEPERVALWERHADHPNEEAFVAGEDVVQVALTPTVQRKLDQGILIRIEPAQTPSEATDDAPPADDNPPANDTPVTEEAPVKSKKARA